MAGLSQENPLKEAFNPRNIGELATGLQVLWSGFDRRGFETLVWEGWEALGFGQRNERVTAALDAFLPPNFTQAAELLIGNLGEELSDEGVASLDGFILAPQCAFIVRRGRDHFDLSARALYEMTKRFSAEGYLRELLEWDYTRALALLHTWTQDSNAHVRRLVSEGIRPRLPLAPRIRKFQVDPSPVLDLLECLKDDPALYVRRSVANNLNDISKDHPDLVVQTLQRWKQGASPERLWLISHSARSLIKTGHRDLLKVMGFSENPKVSVKFSSVSPEILGIGSRAELRCVLVNEGSFPLRLAVDYVVHFIKSGGKIKGKLFKGVVIEIPGHGQKEIVKKHRFINTSGRTHFPGPHHLEWQVNGERHEGPVVILE